MDESEGAVDVGDDGGLSGAEDVPVVDLVADVKAGGVALLGRRVGRDVWGVDEVVAEKCGRISGTRGERRSGSDEGEREEVYEDELHRVERDVCYVGGRGRGA